MFESDLWLAHLPVTIQFYRLGQFEARHRQGPQDALAEDSLRHADTFRLIPPKGFYAQAVSGTIRNELLSAVSIEENIEDLVSPKDIARYHVVFAAHYKSVGALEVGENPFVITLSEIASRLPAEWSQYLSRRRRQHWKPVPGWLVNLRTEERKRKQRLRKPLTQRS